MTSRLLHRAACLAAALAFLAAPSVTHADPYDINGTTVGVFDNFQGGALSFPSGEGSNQIEWGTPALRSYLLYTGANIDTITGSPFVMGALKFHNGATADLNDATSVDLTITLQLTEPPTTQGLPTETLTIGKINWGLADRVDLPTVFAPQTFTVGYTQYTLNVLGFGKYTDDEFQGKDDLVAYLFNSESAKLWGEITAVPVPEPASIAVVAIAGLFGLGHAIRRRRSAVSA